MLYIPLVSNSEVFHLQILNEQVCLVDFSVVGRLISSGDEGPAPTGSEVGDSTKEESRQRLEKLSYWRKALGRRLTPLPFWRMPMWRAEHSNSSSFFEKEDFLAPQEMTGCFLG